jgi:glycosyltransferase involved in cell wall biosynthesis
LDEIYKNTDIGIILYKDVSINYKFCAPNKLFEYWSYGIPVIGDILPGLTSLSVDHKIARFVDLDNTEEVINAINDLSKISKIQIQEMFKSKYSFDNYLEKLEFKLKVK